MRKIFLLVFLMFLCSVALFFSAYTNSVNIKYYFSLLSHEIAVALKLGQESALMRYKENKETLRAMEEAEYNYGDENISPSPALPSASASTRTAQGLTPALNYDESAPLANPAPQQPQPPASLPAQALSAVPSAVDKDTPRDADGTIAYVSETSSPLAREQEPSAAFVDKTGIKWINSSSGHFNLNIQPHVNAIMTPNLAMRFETVYQILNRNISWMLGNKAAVYVYQDRADFLRYEPSASSWAGAFYSPSQNRIVMYDEPSNIPRMISRFSHELTHLFVQNFFNPPDKKVDVEPPIWLNEGLAVNMEDISLDNKGGVWSDDLAYAIISPEAGVQRPSTRKIGDTQIGTLQSVNSTLPIGMRARIFNTDSGIKFKNFREFVKPESYTIADNNGQAENWYFQAFAMVRFLFRPDNSMQPKKRMQFEYFTKMLSAVEVKKDAQGNPMRNSQGKIILQKTPLETALKKAYGFQDMEDFESKFWKWLYDYQDSELSRKNAK